MLGALPSRFLLSEVAPLLAHHLLASAMVAVPSTASASISATADEPVLSEADLARAQTALGALFEPIVPRRFCGTLGSPIAGRTPCAWGPPERPFSDPGDLVPALLGVALPPSDDSSAESEGTGENDDEDGNEFASGEKFARALRTSRWRCHCCGTAMERFGRAKANRIAVNRSALMRTGSLGVDCVCLRDAACRCPWRYR